MRDRASIVRASHCRLLGNPSDRRWMCRRAYVTMQRTKPKRLRRHFNDRWENDRSREHCSDETEALEGARNGAFAVVGCWAARHVRLIAHRHFGGLSGNGSTTRRWHHCDGNSNQSGQDRANERHGGTIGRGNPQGQPSRTVLWSWASNRRIWRV